MNDSIIISQIFWPLLIILWISMIINKSWYKKLLKKVKKAYVSIFTMSLFSFMFWMYIISSFAWFSDIHQSFATIIGFIIVFKSTFYILKPDLMHEFLETFEPLLSNIHYIGTIYLVLWIFISYIAYL